MSLGSRIATRGKAAICANLASTPREPLVFLYPLGIREISTASSRAIPTQKSKTTKHRKRYVSGTIGRSLSTAAGDDVSLVSDVGKSSQAKEIMAPEESSKKQDAQSREDADHPVGGPTAPWTRKEEAEQEQDTPAQLKARKILSSVREAELRQYLNQTTRSQRRSIQQEQLRRWIPDWRVILADLIQHTPQHSTWLDRAVIIQVPDMALSTLLHGIDDNMYDIGTRYDCKVELGSRYGGREFRTFLISGSPLSISKLTADVLQIAPSVRIKGSSKALREAKEKREGLPLAPTSVEDDEVPIGGAARYVLMKRRFPTWKLPIHMVPKPDKWDVNTFADYVQDITRTNGHDLFSSYSYGRGYSRQDLVREVLIRLFRNSETKPHASRAAFNDAISFLAKSGNIADAKDLFVRMDMMNISMDQETFHAFLRQAAKVGDIYNFHFVLHMMLRKGIAPNFQTWVAFMAAVPNLRIRLIILSTMKRKGILQHLRAVQAVCGILAPFEIESCLDSMQTQEQFLAHMDSRYGVKWLSMNSANQILHVLGARGLISRCSEFLFVMEDRFKFPNNYSINTILHHCQMSRNFEGAVEILRNLPKRHDFRPDAETYRILFEIAWRNRSYNLARVIWKYACLSVATAPETRYRVKTSMGSASDQNSKKRLAHFKLLIGDFVTNFGQSEDHPTQVGEALASGVKKLEEFTASTANALNVDRDIEQKSGLDTASETRRSFDLTIARDSAANISPPQSQNRPDLSLKQSKRLELHERRHSQLELELSMWKYWNPLRSLTEMMIEAHDIDAKWKQRKADLDEPIDMKTMLKDAVPIYVVYRMDDATQLRL